MKQTEIFKDVKGYEGSYQVSNLGRVRSLKFNKERILKLSSDSYGYYRCTLSSNGKLKSFQVHQLVAMAFLDHSPNGNKTVVDHVDNDKRNNRLENLQLITHRQNLSKDKKDCSSKYVGVYWDKSRCKWASQIVVEGKLKYLGRFTNEIEAAEAYQSTLKNLTI